MEKLLELIEECERASDYYYANANWFGNLEPLKAPEGLRECSLCRDDEFLLKIKKL